MKIKENSMELNQETLDNILEKNRFEKEEYSGDILEVYEEMKRRIDIEFFCERVELTGYVVLTLGSEMDTLQMEYMQKEQLLNAYLLDCIAGEWLGKIYKKVEKILIQGENIYLKKFQFPGDNIPIEEIEHIFHICKPEKITYNEAYMLKPLKSVAFLAELTINKPKCKYDMCQECSNKGCNHVKCNKKQEEGVVLNYGYQRIFKKQ